MTDFEKAKKIYARMAEYLVPVMKSGMEWVGLFCRDLKTTIWITRAATLIPK